jgi:hypothetical protein
MDQKAYLQPAQAACWQVSAHSSRTALSTRLSHARRR